MKEVMELINSKILAYSGIYIADAQLPSLTAHIEKQASVRKMSPMEFCKSLIPHTPDFDAIINLVTVNETYFFREEKQFDFLKEEVFPKFMGRNLTIWSCCCSTGEEPISLLALALSMNINLTIYASDIDDNALATFAGGKYSTYSLRSDGEKYHKLLEPFAKRTKNEIVFHKEFLKRIQVFKFNLIQGDFSKLPFFDKADLIFMRNVFIYFDKETRAVLTQKITERLKDNGKLFFSMNEIGSLDNTVIPKQLTKSNCGIIYYLEKKVSSSKTNADSTPVGRSLKEKRNQKENQKVHKEVQKVKIQKFSEQNKTSRATNGASSAGAANSDSAFDAKKTYENVCKQINDGDFLKARAIAREIKGTDTKKYSYFMQGYVEYQADNRAEAESLFATAESISPDFWPAFFYHGMVLRDLGKNERAQICFSKCKELISDFGSKVPYDFTLDSFSPSYIFSLCDTFSKGGSL